MLSMSAAHLRVLRKTSPEKRLVWVDIGGGTGPFPSFSFKNVLLFIGQCHSRLGWNIEAMDPYFPISSFDAVYLIDLCEPLLEIARQRFKARGWTNVVCLCQDGTEFVLPEWSDGVHPRESVSFVTLSYSLSMVRMIRLGPSRC